MYNPPHFGETAREGVLLALGLMLKQAAEELGINRITLSRVLNGQAGVGINLALSHETWLDVGRATSKQILIARFDMKYC